MGLWIEYDNQGVPWLTTEGAQNGARVVHAWSNVWSGGTYSGGYPLRVVLHEIQGGASESQSRNHPTPPHDWLDVPNKILYACVPLTKSAAALYRDPNSNVQTNKAWALQTEISGMTSGIRDEPKYWLDTITEMAVAPKCQFAAMVGSPINLDDCPDNSDVTFSARADWPGRYSATRWTNCNGLCAHINVYGNDHWDTGAMDLRYIANHAKIIIGEKLVEAGITDMPDIIFQDSAGTQWGVYPTGAWIKVPGPLTKVYVASGKKVQALNDGTGDWTAWCKDNGLIPRS